MDVGSLEFVLLGVGAFIMALDQSIASYKNLGERLSWLKLSGWTRYIPLILWLSAGLVWTIKSYYNQTSTPDIPKGDITRNNEHSTVTGISPRELLKMRRQLTSFEYQRLEEPYRGASVTVTGYVENVLESKGIATVYLGRSSDGYAIDLVFKKENSINAFRLRGKDKIKANCNFVSMGDSVLFLDQCELI